MNEKEHKNRHIELHKYLDELVADFIRNTGKLTSKSSITELIVWSNGQTQNPSECNESKT